MNATGRRVALSEVSELLAPGLPLPFRILDGEGRLLLAVGQSIVDARQLTALFDRGACVEGTELDAVRAARAAEQDRSGRPGSTRRRTLFDRWERQVWTLDDLLRSLARRLPMAEEIEAFVDDHLELVDRDPDVALFHCIRQDDRRFALYSLTHALHCSAVVLLAARLLGWEPQRAQCALRVALTMNASIVELQARMAEQSDPPTKKQLALIREHPLKSAQMLRAAGITDSSWLAGVEAHHECAGGSGYPRALAEVDELAHLVRSADVFTAKISPRALRAPMAPQAAARQLFQEEGGGPIAGAIIKAVGVYPPGDFVRLRNGDAAIVTRRATAGAGVQVVSLLDARGKPLLNAPRRDAGTAEFAITGALAERTGLPRVLPEQVYGLLEP